MKLQNSNIGKAQLRREQFNRGQSKSQSIGKKSLSKRIIEERVNGITADNIDKEVERLALEVKIKELREQIAYYIRFYIDTRPATYDKDKIEVLVLKMDELIKKLQGQQIDVKQCFEGLENIEKELLNLIENYLIQQDL